MKTNIVPVPSWPKPIVVTEIFLVADDLKSQAVFNVINYADDGTVVGTCVQIPVTGEEYVKWSGDNSQAIGIVLAKLGFEAAPVISEEPVTVTTETTENGDATVSGV